MHTLVGTLTTRQGERRNSEPIMGKKTMYTRPTTTTNNQQPTTPKHHSELRTRKHTRQKNAEESSTIPDREHLSRPTPGTARSPQCCGSWPRGTSWPPSEYMHATGNVKAVNHGGRSSKDLSCAPRSPFRGFRLPAARTLVAANQRSIRKAPFRVSTRHRRHPATGVSLALPI